MRINVYSQELTAEVIEVSKVSNTGIAYKAVQFVLHSSPMLHHPPADDDRSAVTFWLPQSVRGLNQFHRALRAAADLVEEEMLRLNRPPLNSPISACCCPKAASGMHIQGCELERVRSAPSAGEKS